MSATPIESETGSPPSWLRSQVVAAWDRWQKVLRDYAAQRSELAAQEALIGELRLRIAGITSTAVRAELTGKLAESAATWKAARDRSDSLWPVIATTDKVLSAAVEWYDPFLVPESGPQPPASAGVGLAPVALAPILAAIAAVAAIALVIAGVAYKLGESRRNLDAERNIVDMVAGGKLTPEEGTKLLSGVKPDGSDWTTGLVAVGALGVLALLFSRGGK